MSVQDKLQFAVTKRFQCCLDFVGEWSKLIVNDQDSIGTYGHSNVSAGTFEHINITGNFCDFDFDLGEILGVSLSSKQADDQHCKYKQMLFHHEFLSGVIINSTS